MKTPIPILFSIALLAVSPAIAQEAAGVDPATAQAEPVAADLETQITGNISDGKPGLPASKPEPIPFEVTSSMVQLEPLVRRRGR